MNNTRVFESWQVFFTVLQSVEGSGQPEERTDEMNRQKEPIETKGETMARVPNNAHMIEEIAQEAGLFRHILAHREAYTRDFVELFTSRPFTRMVFVGSGSPSHLSATLKYAAASMLGVRADAYVPSLFVHHEGFRAACGAQPEETMLICPVESGRTKGPVYAARMAREAGIPVVCTTLNEQSSLALLSDVVILKPSGEEKAPPSTKGHSTGLFLMLLCFLEAARATGRMSAHLLESYDRNLERLAENVPRAIAAAQQWFQTHRNEVLEAPHYWFLAYGANTGTAAEAVLKFIESHQKPTFAYELEEFLHGPLCAVRPNDIVFFLAAEDGPEKERMLDLYRAMKPDYPHCTWVRSEDDPACDEWDLPIPSGSLRFINALEFLIPVQVLSYEVADALGIDVTVWTTQAIRSKMKPGFDR
jgi:glucoselysine-6-phosphate deglycase